MAPEKEKSKEQPKEKKKSRFNNVINNILFVESGYDKTDEQRMAAVGDFLDRKNKLNPRAFGPYQQRDIWVKELNNQNKRKGRNTEYTIEDSKTMDKSRAMVEEWLEHVVPRLEKENGGPLSDSQIASAYHLGRTNLTMNDISNDMEYQSKFLGAVKYSSEQEKKKEKELKSKPAEPTKTLAPVNPTAYPTAAPIAPPEKDWLDTSMEWMNQYIP